MLLECTKCGTKYRVKDTVAADYSFTCKKCGTLVVAGHVNQLPSHRAVSTATAPGSGQPDMPTDPAGKAVSSEPPTEKRFNVGEGSCGNDQPDAASTGTADSGSESNVNKPPRVRSGLPDVRRAWSLPVLLTLILLVLCALAVWQVFTAMGAIHSPKVIAASMLPALEDLAAVERAERCSELLEQLGEFRAGKPYVVQPVNEYSQDTCEVVAKGKPDEKFAVGGFHLPQWVACEQVRKDFETNVSNHENNLEVKVTLYCGPDGRPSVTADQSALLGAQAQLQKRLPDVVKAVNDGRISADIETCYFGVKAQVSNTAEDMRKLRCKVLSADMEVPRVTYDALWERAALMDELEQFKKENAEEWESLSKSDDVTVLLERFTAKARETACAETNEPSIATISAAAAIAAQTCM